MTAPINHVSDTALWVAWHRSRESERPKPLFHDPLGAVLAGERGREIAKRMPYGTITAWMMVVRTLAIDRLIQEAVHEGVDTVINLGAGLDTRPYRMELPQRLRWIEVDFPHMIRYKAEKLAAEKPRCELRRIECDLSDRPAAQRLYTELGTATKKALVITEGVIPYLTNEQAWWLARDLHAVPTFQLWIQDWRSNASGFRHPKRLEKKMPQSPFKFSHPDPLGAFQTLGWAVSTNVLAVEEGERVGRPFPVPFPFNWLMKLTPKAKQEKFRKGFGFVMLRRS